MNTLMIPTEWLSKKLKLQTKNIPGWLNSGKFAWSALGGSIVIMLLFRRLSGINLPILLIWLALSIIITIKYKPAVFHNLICPFGALQRVSGKLTVFSKRVNKPVFIGCKLCEKDCPTEAIAVNAADKKAEINTALCLQCSNCQQVCPRNRRLKGYARPREAALMESLNIEGILRDGLTSLRSRMETLSQIIGTNYARAHKVLRMAMIAAGNSGDHKYAGLVAPYTDHPDELVREYAAWALARLQSP
jgi:polyferredoxin